MNAYRVQRKIDKLVDEASGYIYKAEHEFAMPKDEERIAIMAAFGGMAIAVGNRSTEGERRVAHDLAQAVGAAIRNASSGSAHVAAPGGHNGFKT